MNGSRILGTLLFVLGSLAGGCSLLFTKEVFVNSPGADGWGFWLTGVVLCAILIGIAVMLFKRKDT
jgi:Na+/melibiose symporter-like transporter